MSRKKIVLILMLITALSIAATFVLLIGKHPDSNGNSARYLVSLGDSVAAGDGLPIDSSLANGPYAECRRSNEAYPVLLAKQLGTTLKQFACSGATIDGAINQSQFSDVPAQLTAAQEFIPGSNVVITVGINDISGLTLVAQCAQASECVNAQEQAALDAGMVKLRSNFSQLLSSVKAAKPRHIVVNTYYDLLAQNDTCFEKFGITGEKIERIRSLENDVNDLLADTAREGGATAVRVDFDGHTLCTGSPWIQGLLDKAPLHPTAAGQKQIATQDAAVLR